MYTLKNRFGNIYKEVATLREKVELEKQGYTLVEATTGLQIEPRAKKRGGALEGSDKEAEGCQ